MSPGPAGHRSAAPGTHRAGGEGRRLGGGAPRAPTGPADYGDPALCALGHTGETELHEDSWCVTDGASFEIHYLTTSTLVDFFGAESVYAL